jgi:hypothetical protein
MNTPCKAGTQTCDASGLGYGACMGEVLPGVEDCAQPGDEDCSGFACAQPLWSKQFGDNSQQAITGIATDASGNVLVAMELTGGADLGGGLLSSAGSVDVVIAKFDPNGNHLWSHRYGDLNSQTPTGIAVDGSGNVVVTGTFSGTVNFSGANALSTTGANDSDIFVVKLDPAGAYIWSKRFGDAANQLGGEVAVDSTGDVYIAGAFSGTVDFGPGPMTSAGSTDIYVGKLASSNGAGLQAKRFGDASAQTAHAIAVDGANNVFLVGTYSGSADFGGGALPNVGALTGYSGAKLTSTLGHVWSKQFGSGSTGGASQTMDVATDAAGNVLVTATFGSSIGAMSINFGGSNLMSSQFAWTVAFAKLDGFGAHLWSKGFGPGVAGNTGRIAVDAAGNLIAAGWFSSPIDFGGGALTPIGNANLFLAKLSSAGQHMWSKRFGSNQPALYVKVAMPAIDPVSSAVLFGGNNLGDVDFGSGLMTTAGGPADAFLSKFAP